MQYRKYYKKMLQLDLDRSYEIHHIDGDRNNNDLKNLVALPKKLHKQYHLARENYLAYFEGGLNPQLRRLSMVEERVLTKFIEIYKECCTWIERRNFRMMECGLLDNPYGIGEIDKEGGYIITWR